MNVIIIPFHDWRKSEKEGFRTRDVHFINALANNGSVSKILVINRPITPLELLYKHHSRNLQGKRIIAKGKFTLTEVSHNVYVADYFSSDILGQVLYRFKWFIKKYADPNYIDFINTCMNELKMENPNLLLQNVFAYKLAVSIKAKSKLFDAWDNFLKFPAYASIKRELEKGYQRCSKEIKVWTTNSNENIRYYQNNFGVSHISLIKNGVKTDFINGPLSVPSDLQKIKKPWIGFGGKISYLMDVDLINYIVKTNPSLSFVFVGQILDRNVYSSIVKLENVHFLGDKKYDVYPNYVRSFDICIVPYHIKNKQHGGDSMKAYEYLLAGKKVVGTNGNGLEDLKDYVYIAHSKEDFSNELATLNNAKKSFEINAHSWESKAKDLIQLLQKY